MGETYQNIMGLSEYDQPGLYLIFEDSACLALTHENIERATTEYWQAPDKIPQKIRESIEFKRCAFCPLKEKEDLCDALRPVLPLLSVLDKHNSYDSVIAVYKGNDKELHHISHTTMQRALRYISILSLISYCRVGRKYAKYYSGIIPITETVEIANRLYLNMFWIHRGDKKAVNKIISVFNREITSTTQNQMKRLRLICENDAFLNAFVLKHMITDVLNENKDKKLKQQLASFETE